MATAIWTDDVVAAAGITKWSPVLTWALMATNFLAYWAVGGGLMFFLDSEKAERHGRIYVQLWELEPRLYAMIGVATVAPYLIHRFYRKGESCYRVVRGLDPPASYRAAPGLNVETVSTAARKARARYVNRLALFAVVLFFGLPWWNLPAFIKPIPRSCGFSQSIYWFVAADEYAVIVLLWLAAFLIQFPTTRSILGIPPTPARSQSR